MLDVIKILDKWVTRLKIRHQILLCKKRILKTAGATYVTSFSYADVVFYTMILKPFLIYRTLKSPLKVVFARLQNVELTPYEGTLDNIQPKASF